MFNPDGARVSQWAEFDRSFAQRPETGFVENWQNTMGLTVDRFLPLSSMQDVESDYSDFFGSNRIQERTRSIQGYLEDGTIPQSVYDQNSRRAPRGGNRTDWNAIAQWANQNLKDDISPFITDEEHEAHRNEILAQRTEYVEDIQQRATGWGVVGQFAGGMHAMVLDPVTLVTLPLSAPAVGVARTSRAMYTASTAWRVAAFNMGIQVPMEMLIMDWNEEIGADYTWKDAGINILATGVLSGGIGGVAANLGHRFQGSFRGRAGDFLSKDRDSLVESFKNLGLEDADAEALASYQHEINNAVEDPIVEVAKDIQQTKDKADYTPEERDLVKEADAILEADKKKKPPKKKKAPKKPAKKFDTSKTYYHSNRGGIQGGTFDNTRLPVEDPDSPFNAHWFSTDDVIPDPEVAGPAGKKHDTVTAVHLNLSKPAVMKDVKAVIKAWKGEEPITPNQIREELSKKGFTHSDWEGRKPIDESVLEEKGKVKMEMNNGQSLWIKQNADGYLEVVDPKDPGAYPEYDTLDQILKEFPESDVIAMFDSKDIHVIQKASNEAADDAAPVRTKDFVEDLEKHQEELNSKGQEIEDVEPVIKHDDEVDVVDTLYDEIPDDLEYYIDGEPMRAKDLVDNYESDLEELDIAMECLING